VAAKMELLSSNCHRQIHAQERRTEAAASREGRSRMLALDERQLSRPVLRGGEVVKLPRDPTTGRPPWKGERVGKTARQSLAIQSAYSACVWESARRAL
jgi:hypothetical protein